MAVVVEDGTIVTDANAYGTVVDAQAYFTEMGYTETASAATVIRGARTLDSMFMRRLKGSKVEFDQSVSTALFIQKVKAGSVEVDFAGQMVARQVMDFVEEMVSPYVSSVELLRA